jgi:uncharacterized protein YdbL (DUF1318 family)
MQHKFTALAVLALVAVLSGCAVKAPEVRITGTRTALENQILGTYAQIQEDVWMVASVRSSEGGEEVVISEEKQRVLDAMQNREFNKDDVDEFKKDGCVGENNQGLLELRTSAKLEQDAEYNTLVQTIIWQENRDRKIIMDRVIELNEGIGPEAQPEVAAVFAKMNRDNARPGDWVQLPNGQWTRKE